MWPFTARASLLNSDEKTAEPLEIMEGSESTYHYHLRVPGARSKAGFRVALCGNERIMPTAQHLAQWNFRGQMRETYCADCAEQAQRMGLTLSAPHTYAE